MTAAVIIIAGYNWLLKEVLKLKKTCMSVLLLLVFTLSSVLLAGCTSVGNQKVIRIGSTAYDYEIPIVEITRQIAAEQGYRVQVVEGNIDYIFEALADGEVDIWPGIRMPFMQEPFQEKYEKRFELGSAIMENAPVGWVVPEYVNIDSIEELKGKEGEVNGKLVGFEADSGMMKVSRDIVKGYNLDLDLVSGTLPSMMDRAQEAFQGNNPVLLLGMRPHSMFRQYSLKVLDDPKGYWPAETYYLGIANGLKEKAPDMYDWSRNFKLSIDDAENLMFSYQQAGRDIEEIARAWVDGNRPKIDAWLGTGTSPSPRANLTRSGFYSDFLNEYNEAGNPDPPTAPGNNGDNQPPTGPNGQENTGNGNQAAAPDRQNGAGDVPGTGNTERPDYYSRFFESGFYDDQPKDDNPDTDRPDDRDQTPSPGDETGGSPYPGSPDGQNDTEPPAPSDETRDETAPDNNAGNTGSMSSRERQLFDMVNQERQKAGLSTFSMDSRLVRLARMKSRDMYENNYFSHTSPTYGTAHDMERDAGISARVMGAENIAKAESVSSAHSLFMNSDDHRANILDSRHDTIGIGIVQGGSTLYVTQLFTGN